MHRTDLGNVADGNCPRGEEMGARRPLAVSLKRMAFSGVALFLAGGLVTACSSTTSSETAAPATSEAAVAESAAPATEAAAEPQGGKFCMINFENGPFLDTVFVKPLTKMFEGTGIEIIQQSEDGDATKAQKIFEDYLVQGCNWILKTDGLPPEPFEPLAARAAEAGILFMNHSVQAVGGAGQNILFDHAVAGRNIGQAAVAWAKKNGIDKPVIGVLSLDDPEGVRRTEAAVAEVMAAFPDAVVAQEAKPKNGDEIAAAKDAGNILASHPDVNMFLTFNHNTGMGAFQAANEAGKTDPSKFFIGMADADERTLDLVKSGNSIVQANWGALFELSAVLMARDSLAFRDGTAPMPTRGLGGLLITTPEDVTTYKAVTAEPSGEAAKPYYEDENVVRWVDVPLKSGQSISDF